jgi:hypothetical protein
MTWGYITPGHFYAPGCPDFLACWLCACLWLLRSEAGGEFAVRFGHFTLSRLSYSN